jgi:hypothetical protein
MNWFEDIEAEIDKTMRLGSLVNKAFGVKIILHHAETTSAIKELAYYNKGFRFEIFNKWKWYFRYRASLLQVKFPRFYAELIYFDYEIKESEDALKKRRKDIIAARRRKVTIAENQLKEYAKNYTSLFDISTDAKYLKFVEIVEKYKQRLEAAESSDFIPTIL